jgi:hypothetical protein
MKVFTIKSKVLAAASYLLRSKDEAVVINFHRDAEVYRQLAEGPGTLAQGFLLPRATRE